jgi:orotidine-5'-phosphate decarboxylase
LTTDYRQRIEEASKEKGSNIILALDYAIRDPKRLLAKCKTVLKAVAPHLCAVKINKQLVLPLALYRGVRELVDEAHALGLQAIMDAKVNDIGNTNREAVHHYYAAGFDAVTANPFVGWEDGLAPVFRLAQRRGRGVLLLVYMSHKGAHEGYGQTLAVTPGGDPLYQYHVFAQKALDWGADGAVVGGTSPQKIREVKSLLTEQVPVYSPGIGVQGGSAAQALQAGATYLIVGRSILHDDDPVRATLKLKERAHSARKRAR